MRKIHLIVVLCFMLLLSSCSKTTVVTVPQDPNFAGNINVAGNIIVGGTMAVKGTVNITTQQTRAADLLINPDGSVNITGELNLGGISSDGTGDILCIKADKTIGTCGAINGVVCTVCN